MLLRRLLLALFLLATLWVAAPATASAASPLSALAAPEEPVVRGASRRGKGSGFWTSDVPTEDRPYRWSYLLVGLGVVIAMGGVTFVLIRRAARQRQPS